MEHRANVTGEIERKFEVPAAGEVASLDPTTVLGVWCPPSRTSVARGRLLRHPDLRLLLEG
jgi:hypothetical protein